MYQLSDLSHLDHGKYLKRKNALDKYLELENLLPHSNTLSIGYRKGSHFDNVIDSNLKKEYSQSSLNLST